MNTDLFATQGTHLTQGQDDGSRQRSPHGDAQSCHGNCQSVPQQSLALINLALSHNKIAIESSQQQALEILEV